MYSKIYIDPKIDLDSEKYVEVLIEFKVEPAKVAVVKSASGLTIEQAVEEVEASHQLFEEEIKNIKEKQIKYFILQTYKDSFNGVAVKLRGNTIKYLLQSTVIKAIYKNQEIGIPKKPVDTMYEI